MSLIEHELTPVVIMEKVRTPDGEGGFFVEWKDGVQINVAITFDASMQARIAEKQGVSSLYTITAPKNAKLEYHDVIRRLEDGKIFRVTSDGDDKITPKVASFQFLQVTAEEWRLA